MADGQSDVKKRSGVTRHVLTCHGKAGWEIIALIVGVTLFFALWFLITAIGRYPAFILPDPFSVYLEFKTHRPQRPAVDARQGHLDRNGRGDWPWD